MGRRCRVHCPLVAWHRVPPSWERCLQRKRRGDPDWPVSRMPRE